MWPLCETNMMSYIQREPIDQQNISDNIFGYNHEETNSNLSIFACLPVYAPQVAPWCHNFSNKWSWGLYVIPILWVTYRGNKLTHKTYLVMYSVTIIMIQTQICWFSLAYNLGTHVAPRCTTFEINGYKASVLYQYDESQFWKTNWPIKPIW